MKTLKRYLFFIVVLAIAGIVTLFRPEIGTRALSSTLSSLKEMLLIVPPVFVLLGLLDVWVPRATMVRFLGENSGLTGILISLLLGSAAAGPLYGAFPVALVFMKKGAKFSNVLLFIGAWSTTKIPLLIFEMSALGTTFMLTRLAVSLVGIFVIAFAVEKAVGKEEIARIYEKAEHADE